VVGYFVHPLVLRARFDRDTTFADAVRAAGRQVVRGTAHAGYPYPMLLRTLGRTAGAPPLFRIAVTMVTASRFDATLDRLADGESGVYDGGLRMAPLDVPRLEGQYDLNVEITRSATGMTLVLRYDTDLFDAATMRRLAGAYVRLLEVSVTDPSTRVSRVSLMDDAERARVLALGAS
jgi:non-ribosomal peptide synthetase component F